MTNTTPDSTAKMSWSPTLMMVCISRQMIWRIPLYVIVLFLLQLDFFFLTPSIVLGYRELLRLRRPRQAHGAPDHHGTRCAGQVAARKNNAYDLNTAGIRILGSRITSMMRLLRSPMVTTRLAFIAAAEDRQTTVRPWMLPNILLGKLFLKALTTDDKEKGLYTFSQAAMVESWRPMQFRWLHE